MRGWVCVASIAACAACALDPGVGAAYAPDPSWAVVDAAGGGDYTTVQAAIDAHIAPGEGGWRRILVRDGMYTERIEVPATSSKLLLEGESRAGVRLELDECYVAQGGVLRAHSVVRVWAEDVVIRSLTVTNLADEPGGCGGAWDHAVRTESDRVVLDDVTLRADHDTLITKGARNRVFVTNSHIQGRGDFVTSFTSLFVETSRVETIRFPSHLLFQDGATPGPDRQETLVVRDSSFAGLIDKAGVTRMYGNAHLYLIGNTFEDGLGADRPVVHYYEQHQPAESKVWRYGNSSTGPDPLIWDRYSYEGPTGRIEQPVGSAAPYAHVLELDEAARVQPDACFWGWDARATLTEARGTP